ncbi:hypothetical protein [Fibrobacter sp. UWB5]|uniref:hypothetical protein n=1 Tax=Fibrobacter sp. UWB5 TaxID=1964360 RepID=UPI000B521308|nr:hypothetical protein [Fibrobacter sp. UWB5]OWV14355.1 hypothetical protein B7989_02550 [Fibrobacter sp. UWB5]
MIKSLLYIFAASAFVSVIPYLATFEKEYYYIPHGIFSFFALALLLLYVYVRNRRAILWRFIIVAALLLSSFVDMSNFLYVRKETFVWYFFLPFVTVPIALLVTRPVKKIDVSAINLVLFSCLSVHILFLNIVPSQPLFEFPMLRTLSRLTPYTPPRNQLPSNFKDRYNVTDSVKITRQYIDTARSNVVVLVESWGIPMDTNRLNSELTIFSKNLTNYGAHFRRYSRTRTAECEDLLDSVWKDSTERIDSLFIPNRLAKIGFKNTFLFGGDSLIQRRNKYVHKIGFAEALFTSKDSPDSMMVAKMDSLLADTTQKRFIAWTTRDTRFPISDDPIKTEKLYYERLFGTLRIIADLARKHPDVRFIVQGDHEPILSPLEFQAKFYRRWVPYMVLN